MKIPKTTEEKPYIKFEFDKKGKLYLSIDSSWWGGINGGFITSKGRGGNTCYPKDLKKYMDNYKKRKIKQLWKEIKSLENQIRLINSYESL